MSMTIAEAIKQLDGAEAMLFNRNMVEFNRAVIMAIDALREQEERRWIPVTDRMPEERESIVPNWGTVSKPVLVAFVCTTSEELYPQNCVVCEAMSHNGVFTHKSYSGEYKAIAWMPKPTPPKEEAV